MSQARPEGGDTWVPPSSTGKGAPQGVFSGWMRAGQGSQIGGGGPSPTHPEGDGSPGREMRAGQGCSRYPPALPSLLEGLLCQGAPVGKEKADVSQWPLGMQASPTAVSSVRVRAQVPPAPPHSTSVPPPFGPDPRWLHLLTRNRCRGAATAGDVLPSPQTGPSPRVCRGPAPARAQPVVGGVSARTKISQPDHKFDLMGYM